MVLFVLRPLVRHYFLAFSIVNFFRFPLFGHRATFTHRSRSWTFPIVSRSIYPVRFAPIAFTPFFFLSFVRRISNLPQTLAGGDHSRSPPAFPLCRAVR